MKKDKIKIVHVITSLKVGGAEKVLLRQLREIKGDPKYDIICEAVLSLKGKGPVGEQLESIGVPVVAIKMHKNTIRGLYKLGRYIKSINPDLVQTWLYHADLFGGGAARMQGIPVVWDLHNEDPNSTRRLKTTTRIVTYINSLLSRLIPTRIVSCSQKGAKNHAKFGFTEDKITTIPNGFDTENFKPDSDQRDSVRNELGIPNDAPIIGMVARLHPKKDYDNLLQAILHIEKKISGLHFILVGEGVNSSEALFRQFKEKMSGSTLHLLGRRDDVPRLLSAFDIATLSSWAEAFPLVLGEAMATGVPCVATDVGDVAQLLGDTGVVVPPEDPLELARGWYHLLKSPSRREEMGHQARQRVRDEFSIESVLKRYEIEYKSII